MINKHFKVIVTALVLLLVVSTVSAVSAAEFTETTSGNLNQAVTNAQSSGDVSDTITLNPGTYTGNNNKNIDVNGNNKNLTVQGNGDSSSVILDAESNGIFFNITGNNLNVTFKNLTFKNGKNTNNGGAITNNIASNQLTFVNCIFINNIAANGGAIYSNGSLSVTKSNFINNSASDLGDSIFIDDSAQVNIIINNVFTTNVSSGVVEIANHGSNDFDLDNNTYYYVGDKKINVNLTHVTVLNNRVTVFADVFNVDGLINNGDVVFFVKGVGAGRVPVINGKASYSFNSKNGIFEVYGDYVHTNLTPDTPDTHGINSLNFSVNYTSFAPQSVPLPNPGSGVIFWVAPGGSDSNSGLSLASPKLSLRGALDTALSGDTIIVMPGTYSGTNNRVTISKDITIIGNETSGSEVIFSPANARFISISAGTSASALRNVNLYNFKIANPTTSGTIYPGAYVNLVVDNLRVSDKTNGNGVFVFNGANSNLIINNSDFYNLNGNNGTLIFSNTYNNLKIIVDNSNVTFARTGNGTSTSTTDGFFGAVICVAGNNVNLTLNHSNFKNIYGGWFGGIIFCYGASNNVIIDNSNMTNSSVRYEGSIVYVAGGSTYSKLIISNSNFKDANSTYSGIDTNGGWTTELYNSTFNNFYGRIGHGSIIDNDGREITVVGCTFTNNVIWNSSSAAGGGGVIFNHAAYANTIRNSTFINNSANHHGGAIVSTGALVIDDCRFIGNYINGSALSYGGVIYNNGTLTISISNSYFESNVARTTAATSGGGVVATLNGIIDIHNSVFVNNAINGTGATNYGGVFAVNGTGSISADNCTFENNYAKHYGGIAGTTNAGSRINITNSRIVNNSAGTYGGALGSAGGQITIYNTTMTNNKAGSYGGVAGVSSTGANIFIYNSQGHNNYATTFGGVLGANGGSIVLNGSVFTNNSAGSYGGVAGIAQGS
ncbi:beta strand repeat-containing protein, partial [Methanobrevibacter curvatus]|uniref:beta strand repeat-containing protein n=1 Tax=Methanobrevibacter curvatus TaxID=49547 RepID=UPI000AA29864